MEKQHVARKGQCGELTSDPIGAWDVKLEIISDRPTDGQTNS